MKQLKTPKTLIVFSVTLFLAIPIFAQKSMVEPEKIDEVRHKSDSKLSGENKFNKYAARKSAKLLRKLSGDWRYSNQVFMISGDGQSIQIENVAFYYKCRLTGTSGRVWKGVLTGNEIRGTYKRIIKGKTFEHPFIGEIAKNGKSITLRYKEVVYVNPVGGMPGQFVKIAAADKLHRN